MFLIEIFENTDKIKIIYNSLPMDNTSVQSNTSRLYLHTRVNM